VIIICPECKTKYRLKDDTTVAEFRCRKCQAAIDVKPAGAEPAAEEQTISRIPQEPPREERAEAPTAQLEPPREHPAEPGGQGALAKGQDTEELADELLGKTLDGYEIIRKIGQGGMGAVYEARQVALDRHVALKVLPAHLAANKDFITRFTREALSAAKLNHTNIIQVHDVGKAKGIYFFVMEFVRGKTLGDIIDEEGTMELIAAVGYILQAARGLEYAHRKGIIHRDIKPENLMLNEEGVVKVADLGLAKKAEGEELSVTVSGVGMGTSYYISPEQASDAKHVDHRADIYSLGCTLYHLITGQVPYEGGSAYEVITKHIKEPLVLPEVHNPQVPKELSAVVAKMMAKTKEERYESMKDVIEALEDYLGVNYAKVGFHPREDQIAVLASHAKKIESIQKDRKCSLFLVAVSALVAVVLIGSIWIGVELAFAVVVYVLLTPLCYFVLFGVRRKTYLYRRVRKFFFGNRISDWLVIIILIMVAAACIVLLGVVVPFVIALILSGATAIGYYRALKQPLLERQDAVLEETDKLMMEIERKGVPEEDLQLFVCQYGGEFGELMCEEMYGYESVVRTRRKRSPEELEKRSFATAFREWIIGRLREAEKRRRKQEGVAAPEAVPAPSEAPSEAPPRQGLEAPEVAEEAARGRSEEPAAEIERKKAGAGALLTGIPRFILGAKGRLTLGAILLLLCFLSIRGLAFAGSPVFASYNYVLFSFALFLSGLARSRGMLACLCITCILVGPVAYFMRDSFLGEPLTFLEAGTRTMGGIFADTITPIVVAGIFFLLFGFVAAFLFKGTKTPPRP
jgi:hypothetical protein